MDESRTSDDRHERISKTDAEWRKELTPEQYRVARCGETERPFSGKYWDHKERGTYYCASCGLSLFGSETKFDSGTGWPSYWKPMDPEHVAEKKDSSYGMMRTEVSCARCGAHLGHVFDDGPEPTGRRFCINSASLGFKAATEAEEAAVKTPAPARAMFAAGCFWGVEAAFRRVKGVVDTAVGYAGGTTENPTYRQVCTGRTGHAETVLVEFDPSVVSYADLLEVFWQSHDPTQLNRQGPDVGTQYRSAIFYFDEEQKRAAEESKARLEASGRHARPIATDITRASTFYRAEEYHQRYLERKGRAACHLP